MKKFLLPLSLMLLGGAAAANAQEFTDLFKVEYNGQSYTEGQTIEINSDYTDSEDFEGCVTYLPHIKVINLDKAPRLFDVTMSAFKPTQAEIEAQDSENPTYGYPSLCFEGAYAYPGGGASNGCFASGTGWIGCPAAGTDTCTLDLHLEDAPKDAEVTLRLILTGLDGEPEANGDKTPVQEFTDPMTLYVHFSTKENSVDEIGVDLNAPAEYYDLQGRKIANPEKGLYIVKQGDKVVKTFVR